MSRVAKKPVALPKGVECTVAKDMVTVKGPKGTLKLAAMAGVEVGVTTAPKSAWCRPRWVPCKMAGTARALIANMIKGVSEGYQRKLELVGVGYRAALQGKELNLTLGFSHPVVFKTPDGITITVPTQTEILITGNDKQRVGEVAAKIRRLPSAGTLQGQGRALLGREDHLEGSQEGLKSFDRGSFRTRTAFSFPENEDGQEHFKTAPRQSHAHAHSQTGRAAPVRASHWSASLRSGHLRRRRQGAGSCVDCAESGCRRAQGHQEQGSGSGRRQGDRREGEGCRRRKASRSTVRDSAITAALPRWQMRHAKLV